MIYFLKYLRVLLDKDINIITQYFEHVKVYWFLKRYGYFIAKLFYLLSLESLEFSHKADITVRFHIVRLCCLINVTAHTINVFSPQATIQSTSRGACIGQHTVMVICM